LFPSVIVFRLRFGRSARVMERLLAVLSSATAALEKGRWLSSMKAEFGFAHCRSSIELELG